MPGLALIFAVCLALIHLGASRFSLARAEPRSRWLSLAGGASVAYVFVHILPELKKGQDVMVRADLPLEFLEHHVYIVALLGYGIGLMTPIHELMLAVLFAFLAGGVILNVIKEELPKEQESLFWAFALGAALYTALLLAL